jgi:hypothetical protein
MHDVTAYQGKGQEFRQGERVVAQVKRTIRGLQCGRVHVHQALPHERVRHARVGTLQVGPRVTASDVLLQDGIHVPALDFIRTRAAATQQDEQQRMYAPHEVRGPFLYI